MDFKEKVSIKFLKQLLLRAKFSIRMSIFGVVLTLLVGVAILVISVDYFSIRSILIKSARNSLIQSSGRVSEQIGRYLRPLNSSVLTARRMFQEGVIDPKRPDFPRFLYSLVADNENLVAAYWGDAKGNFYWLNKEKEGYFEEIILRDGEKVTKVTRKEFSKDGTALADNKNLINPDLDPRLRPWYKNAKLRKSLTWVIYNFIEVGDQKAQLGITSAFPVYDFEGNLLGVFGIDMLLGAISDYVKSIELTENSFIFIIDRDGYIITAYTEQEQLLTFDEVPDITDFKLPWLRKSFVLYNQKKESPLVYSLDRKDYIATYEKILHVKTDSPWFVAIVTPVNDIVSPLRQSVLIGAIFTILVFIMGVIMASILSSSLSRPIKKLAKDANLICQLRLDNIKQLFSRIKEIADMADSFMRMKNALYSFQRYMPVALVKKLIASNKIAAVGGEAKDLTLLFTDIQDFTHLSEDFDPEELMHYLSEYFQSITKVVLEMQGTVDKYIGDGVMAFWGAPINDEYHTLHACQAALKMREALEQLNLKWHKENKPKVYTRFGINSGRVVVGNVGSDDRLGYTTLGDPVNLASRLEILNKTYGTTIMVSEFVYRKVKDKFRFRLLDRVAVKGKRKGVYVYELVEEISSRPDLELEKYNNEFSKAFGSYTNGDWETAKSLFESLSKQYPDDKVVSVFISRCSGFLKNPPSSWNGIWVMDEK